MKVSNLYNQNPYIIQPILKKAPVKRTPKRAQMNSLKIIIPMAGRGKRFVEAGYATPKPLLKIDDKLILSHIIDSMKTPNSEFIFLPRQDHCDEHQLDKVLQTLEPSSKIVKVNEITEGAICTVLLAKEHFNDESPVIIKDCDQIINWDPKHFLDFVQRNKADAAVVTIHTDKPHYSFAKLDSDGKVIQTAEKSVISNYGNTGIYYFAKGSQLIKYAEKLISKNIRVNNEFYTAPVYNEYIQDGKLVLNYPIAEMFQLGTPEELVKNQNKVIEFLNSQG
jgi:NDP-sugar pyrophosphorylase family protein